MKDSFKNSDFQKQFEENGYVTIPLLSEPEIESLLQFFQSQVSEISEVFHTSHFSSNTAYKQAVHDKIVDVVFKKAANFLTPHIPVFGNFMVKQPNSKVYMQLHADWAYVEETQYRGISIWLPLVDTTKINGCLGVLPGSHKVLNAVRGPGIKQSSYKSDALWVKKFGNLLPMKAGEAIFYDHALMHYSPSNKSGKVRPAINLSIVPQSAEIIHYSLPGGEGDTIEKYTVNDPSFFINYTHFQRPESAIPVSFIPLQTVVHIDNRMKDFKSSIPENWLKSLLRYF